MKPKILVADDDEMIAASIRRALIYAESPRGPLLIGVRFEIDGLGDTGTVDAGPVIVWHSHDDVCFELLQVGLAGLESPFGGCPIGSINIPKTGETLHMWSVPGLPIEDHWGNIDEQWLDAYLSDLGRNER